MRRVEPTLVNTAIGLRDVDSAGSPVGVVHMDPGLSYAGVGPLLQAYCNEGAQSAWKTIKEKIDYTYRALDLALTALDDAVGFGRAVQGRVGEGQKLFFKPNLLNPMNIHPQTHGPDVGSTTCTEWPFVAALMRWFHDRLGISYHQMALGEAATGLSSSAGFYSFLNPSGRRVTTEAVIEGRSGDFYGGWGFYFVRQYLAESLAPGQKDDPMRGYEESVEGSHLPPGLVADKLMVYDLNRLHDDESKGREVEVPHGINFRSITLHKAIVGGDPRDPEDRRAYPGCVLVNVPRLKVHALVLLTNALKNLGIGLYPMESAPSPALDWHYARPWGAMPGGKGGIPHQVWVPEIDLDTGLPSRDARGEVVVQKTGGLSASMADIVEAVSNQGIYMLHVVDGVEAINYDHSTPGGRRVSEGLALASLDPVAADLLCARYMFSNVSLAEAEAVDLDDGVGGRFPQRVPVPTVESGNIVTGEGYDCPLARDLSLAHAEERGLGRQAYHVIGQDLDTGRPIVSVLGHLGTVAEANFHDLTTSALYFANSKLPWDLQKTVFGYLEAVDELTDSCLKRQLLEALDEDGDGVVTYEEKGRKGVRVAMLMAYGIATSMRGTEPYGYLRGPFTAGANRLGYGRAGTTPDDLTAYEERAYGQAWLVAMRMSQAPDESPDPFVPSLTWGRGKWPSFQLASHVHVGTALYGPGFPGKVGYGGLYGLGFQYADATQNGSGYVGRIVNQPDTAGLDRYLAAVMAGEASPLDFTLYVPTGYGRVGGRKVPNVEETGDPFKLFTASFLGGEAWPPARAGAELRERFKR